MTKSEFLVSLLLIVLLLWPPAPKTALGADSFTKVRFGVNLAGAEFGHSALPGTFDKNYTYPPAEELDYYKSKGRTLIRLPFLWERIQHSLNAPLDKDELARLKGVLHLAAARGMDVIIDVHNYGRYEVRGAEKDEDKIIGTAKVPYSAFADLWSKLASTLKDEKGVYGYGLMNEPMGMGDENRWPRAAQAAIDAIRKVDPKTPIFVCGDQFGSARDWRRGSNEKLNEKVRDPNNNLIFEAHSYLDKNLSGAYKGTYDEEEGSPDVGIEHVQPFVEWCKEKGVRGFIGEFGVPDNDTRWLVALDRLCAYLQENNISATYWAGGPWWGPYPLSIEPTKTADGKFVDRPQMLVLRQYPG